MSMVKRPKRPRDTNQLAKLMVDILTGQVEDREPTPEEPAAVSLGRRGGLKGGKAPADKLSPERRSKSLREAAGYAGCAGVKIRQHVDFCLESAEGGG